MFLMLIVFLGATTAYAKVEKSTKKRSVSVEEQKGKVKSGCETRFNESKSAATASKEGGKLAAEPKGQAEGTETPAEHQH